MGSGMETIGGVVVCMGEEKIGVWTCVGCVV